MEKRKITALFMAFLMLWQLMPINVLADYGIVLLSNETGATTYHKVSFVINKLESGDTGETIISDQMVAHGAAAIVPDVPDVDGYKFTGWTAEPETSSLTNVTAETTFTAQYKKLAKRTVTVKFVYADGGEARPTQVYEYDEESSETLTITPEAIQGFSLSMKDENNETITLDENNGSHTLMVSGLTADKTFTVTYSGAQVKYYVEHHKQKIDLSGYVTPDEGKEEKQGMAGTPTAAAAKTEPDWTVGFTIQPFEQKRIAVDDSTVVDIYYDRNVYNLTYNTDGGTYVENARVPYGKDVKIQSVAKAGYEFINWSYTVTKDDGTTDTGTYDANAEFAMPAGNVELTANWRAVDTASYTVVYWIQKTSDYYGTTDKQYDYVKSVSRTVNLTNGADTYPTRIDVSPKSYVVDNTDKFYSLNEGKSNVNASGTAKVKVKPDGTTVYNVYFDRKTITYNFWRNSNSLTLKGLYGQTFDEAKAAAGKAGKTAEASNYGWPSAGEGKIWNDDDVIGLITYLNGFYTSYFKNGTTTYTFEQANGQSYHVIQYTQNLDQTTWKMVDDFAGSTGSLRLIEKFVPAFSYYGYKVSNKTNSYSSAQDPDCVTISDSDIKHDVGIGKTIDPERNYKYIEVFNMRNSFRIDYKNCAQIESGEYLFEQEIPYPGVPEKPANVDQDYVFAGWFEEDQYKNEVWKLDEATNTRATYKMPAANLVVYAKWNPPTKTVKYHLNYVDATPEPYASYEVTKYETIEEMFAASGNELPEVFPATPSRDGYTFGGWYADKACTTPIPNDFVKVQIIRDWDIYAKWTPIGAQNVTSTAVIANAEPITGYYEGDQWKTIDNITMPTASGLVDTTVTLEAPDIPGYMPVQRFVTHRIVEGVNIVNIEYIKLDTWVLTVNYWEYGTDVPVADSYTDANCTETRKSVVYKVVPGGEDEQGNKYIWKLTNEPVQTATKEDPTVTFYYKKVYQKPYTVKHYRQKSDGKYSEPDVENLKGWTGYTVTATSKDYGELYTLTVTKETKQSGTVTADGTLELRLYYNLPQYTVTYKPGDHGNFVDNVHNSVYHGADTPAFAGSKDADGNPLGKQGYTFAGWAPTPAGTVTANAIYIAQWTANENTAYKVEHYTQNGNSNIWTLVKTDDEKTGKTGTSAAYEQVDYPGFTYDPALTAWTDSAHTTAVLVSDTPPTIAGDGTLVIKLYYTRNQYTVTYEYEGTAPGHATPLPAQATYWYEEEVTLAPQASAIGYTFDGWYTKAGAAVAVGASVTSFTMPAADVTLYGKFTRNVDEDGIEVTKKWHTNDGTVPITVTLARYTLNEQDARVYDESFNATVDLPEDNAQSGTVWKKILMSTEAVPLYTHDENGNAYTYEIKSEAATNSSDEDKFAKYDQEFDGLSVSNTNKYTIVVNKTWIDASATLRPTVSFKLYSNDGSTEPIQTALLTKENTATFTDVPYNANGYIIKEVMEGETASVYESNWTNDETTIDANTKSVDVTNTILTAPLTIKKTVYNNVEPIGNENLNDYWFGFAVKKDEEVVETVYINGNDKKTVENLIIGQTYTIEEIGVYTRSGDSYIQVDNGLNAWTTEVSSVNGEVTIAQSKEVTIAQSKNEITFINTRKTESDGISFDKQWIDGENTYHRRPTAKNFAAMLTLKDGAADDANTKVVSEENITIPETASANWKITFTNLPTYKLNGERYEYTLVESLAGNTAEWYTATVATAAIGKTLKNTLKTVKVTVTKSVSDVSDEYVNSTFEISGGFTYTDANGATQSNSENEKFSASLVGGESEEYTVPYGATVTVEEKSVSGWTTTYSDTNKTAFNKNDEIIVTNTRDVASSLNIVKEWIAPGSQERPELKIQIQRRAGEGAFEDYKSVTLGVNGTWTAELENVPTHSEDGKVYTYQISGETLSNGSTLENYVPKYSDPVTLVKGEGATLTVTNTSKMLGDQVAVTVTKTWEDESDYAGLRPAKDDFTVTLTANHEAEQHTHEITDTNWTGEANVWTATVLLNKYSSTGAVMKYAVSETSLEGYTPDTENTEPIIPANDDNLVSLTNSYAPKKVTVTAEKVWDDGEDSEGIRPDSVQLGLYADGVLVENSVKTTVGGEVKWENLYEYAAGTKDTTNVITYDVFEVIARNDGSYEKVDENGTIPSKDTGNERTYSVGYSKENNYTTVTNAHDVALDRVSVSVEKNWTGGDMPESAQIGVTLLYSTDEGESFANYTVDAVKTMTLSDGKYTAVWTDLPKYAKVGENTWNVIQYKVQETTVPTGWKISADDKNGVPATGEGNSLSATITNTRTTATLTVTKEWKAVENITTPVITIDVMQDNSFYQQVTLGEGGVWTTTLENVPTHSIEGTPYSYSLANEAAAKADDATLALYVQALGEPINLTEGEENNLIATNTRERMDEGEKKGLFITKTIDNGERDVTDKMKEDTFTFTVTMPADVNGGRVSYTINGAEPAREATVNGNTFSIEGVHHGDVINVVGQIVTEGNEEKIIALPVGTYTVDEEPADANTNTFAYDVTITPNKTVNVIKGQAFVEFTATNKPKADGVSFEKRWELPNGDGYGKTPYNVTSDGVKATFELLKGETVIATTALDANTMTAAFDVPKDGKTYIIKETGHNQDGNYAAADEANTLSVKWTGTKFEITDNDEITNEGIIRNNLKRTTDEDGAITIVKAIDWNTTEPEVITTPFELKYSYTETDGTEISGTIEVTFDGEKLIYAMAEGAEGICAIKENGVALTNIAYGTQITVTETPNAAWKLVGIDGLTNGVVTASADAQTVTVKNERVLYDPNPDDPENVLGQIAVHKTWMYGDKEIEEADEKFREPITIELYRSDVEEKAFRTADVTSEGVWATLFTELPAADPNSGVAYIYTMKEAGQVTDDTGVTTITLKNGYTFSVTMGAATKTEDGVYQVEFINTLNDNEPEKPEKTADESDDEAAENDGVHIGDEVTYTITRTSHLNTTTTATIIDTLPTGVAYKELVSLTVNGKEVEESGFDFAQNDGKATWTIKNVPPMGRIELVFTATVTAEAFAAAGGELVNNAEVDLGDDDDANFKDANNTLLTPDLKIEKTIDDSFKNEEGAYEIRTGDEIRYSITVTNSGKVAAKNVTVVDTLPAGLENVEAKIGEAVVASVEDASDGKKLTITLDTVEAEESVEIIVTGTVTALYGQIGGNAVAITKENDQPVDPEDPDLKDETDPIDVRNPKVTLSKIVSNNDVTSEDLTGEETYTFKFYAQDGTTAITGVKYTKGADEDELTAEGVSLKHGESVTFELPPNATYTIVEETTDAWTTTWTVDGAAGEASRTQTVTLGEKAKAADEPIAVQATNTRTLYDPDPDDPENTLGEVTIEKQWLDGNGEQLDDHLIPEETAVQLYRESDGKETEAVEAAQTLSRKNDWSHTYEKLPATDLNGNAYTYTVKEIVGDAALATGDIAAFTMTSDTYQYQVGIAIDNDIDGFMVTNTMKESEPTVPQKTAKEMDQSDVDGDNVPENDGVEIGDLVEYTITRTSHLNTTATATIIDSLPEGLVYDEDCSYTVTINGDEVENYTFTENPLTWVVEDIPPMGTVKVIFTAKVTREAVKLNTLTNKATVDLGDENDAKIESPDEVIDVKQPALSIVKEANKTVVKPGDELTYTLTVANTGEGKATEIVVTDALPDQIKVDAAKLPVGLTYDEQTHTLSWTISEVPAKAEVTITFDATVLSKEELDENGCTPSIRNTAEITDRPAVTPDDPEPDPNDKDDEETPIARFEVEKTVEIIRTEESDIDRDEDPTTASLNDIIRFEVKVTNTGACELTDIVISDPMIKRAVETSVEAIPSSTEYPDAILMLDKLGIGEETIITLDIVVTEADILEGWVVNTATATAQDPTDPDNPDKVIEEKDTIETPTDPKDGFIKVTKEVTNEPANGETYALGETITYEVTVTNDGNLTVTDITVTDELTEEKWTIESLAPAASETFETSYVVTEADILAGKVLNVATATGTSPDPDEPDVPSTPGEAEEETDEPNAHLTTSKTVTNTPANGETYALGETISYEVTVTNDGNLTVTNIMVTDELTEEKWTIESLAPAASETFETSYVVTEADILAGKVLNVATATGTSPDPDEPDVPSTPGEAEEETDEPNAHLTTSKTVTNEPANGETYALGETITYEVTVTNDGNLTITDITVTDELTEEKWTIESLAPAASETFETSYVVTEADILAGKVLNVATATGTSPDPDEPDVPSTPGEAEEETDKPNPHTSAVKVVTSTPKDGKAYGIGEVVTYKITVTNDGNLTIYDLQIIDTVSADDYTPSNINLTVEGDLETPLAPGESRDFTCAYTVVPENVLPPYDERGIAKKHSIINVAYATGTNESDVETTYSAGRVDVPANETVTVMFVDTHDWSMIEMVEIPYGGLTKYPKHPIHEGYYFDSWFGSEIKEVYTDLIVYALYKPLGEANIPDAQIPMAGGYISNVGDCFD